MVFLLKITAMAFCKLGHPKIFI